MPESFSAVVADLVARIEKLEKEVAELRGEAARASVAEDSPVIMDFPDIKGFDEVPDFPENGNEEVPEEVTLEDVPEENVEEDIPEGNPDDDAEFVPEEGSASAEEGINEEAAAVETEPEDLPDAEDGPDNSCTPEVHEIEVAMEPEEAAWGTVSLFGDEVPAAAAPVRRRGMKETLNDEVPARKTVLDAMTEGSAWRHDIPGPEVRELRSAIGLGDKVYFCHALFRDDNALYQDTVLKLNAMKKLDDAVEYLRATFPEWDWNSDKVYRFMMAVRRKIRN